MQSLLLKLEFSSKSSLVLLLHRVTSNFWWRTWINSTCDSWNRRKWLTFAYNIQSSTRAVELWLQSIKVASKRFGWELDIWVHTILVSFHIQRRLTTCSHPSMWTTFTRGQLLFCENKFDFVLDYHINPTTAGPRKVSVWSPPAKVQI